MRVIWQVLEERVEKEVTFDKSNNTEMTEANETTKANDIYLVCRQNDFFVQWVRLRFSHI